MADSTWYADCGQQAAALTHHRCARGNEHVAATKLEEEDKQREERMKYIDGQCD